MILSPYSFNLEFGAISWIASMQNRVFLRPSRLLFRWDFSAYRIQLSILPIIQLNLGLIPFSNQSLNKSRIFSVPMNLGYIFEISALIILSITGFFSISGIYALTYFNVIEPNNSFSGGSNEILSNSTMTNTTLDNNTAKMDFLNRVLR